MPISQTNQVDYLFKKIGYGITKTANATVKSPSNETISSPLTIRGDVIWQQSASIPATIPASNSSVVTLYADSVSSAVQTTADATAPTSVSWKTGLTNWIDPSFGATYQVKVYLAPTGNAAPQTYGTQIFPDGTGANDFWFFDYNSGVLNFPDAIPSVITSNPSKVIYIVGARYVGQTGITSFVGNTTFANITVTGTETITGNLTTGNILASGNIIVSGGNVTVSKSAFFIGNTTTGVDAIYAGIPTGYTHVTNDIAQFSGNVDGYTQVNFQNINSGSNATTDWVATANNGTDTTYYVDLGIASSGYDPLSPTNSLGTSLYPNDAYLYTQGSTGSAGGNLVIGTSTPGTITSIIAGGVNSSNVVTTFSNTAVNVKLTTSSTSTTTGAIIVAGGVGVGGNLNVGGNVSTGNVLLNGNIFSNTPITITSTSNGVITLNTASALGLPIGGNIARPALPTQGLIRFNTDIDAVEYYTGAGWEAIVNAVSGQSFYGDGTSTTFTLDKSATTNSVLVSMNGTVQQPGIAYSVTGNQISFVEIPLVSDLIDVRFLAAATVANFESMIVAPIGKTVTTANTIVDTFNKTIYRGAKYTISSTTATDAHMAEVHVTQFNGVVAVNSYGVVNTGSNYISYSANISGNNVNLLALGTANSTVRIQSTYFNI